jgi:release factor glutamine methyltransferase
MSVEYTQGTDTVAESLQEAARTLGAHSDSPRLDAEVLLAHVLGCSRTGLIVAAERALSARETTAFTHLLARRRTGTPIAYLTGMREFWSLPLHVTPAVLVPRPETETLVTAVLADIPRDRSVAVLDLGTGSGAIALAIQSERPRAQVTGSDLSAGALAVAVENARHLGLPQIRWRQGAWFEAVPGERFDCIVSNPPYVAEGDPALARLAAEPRLALTPGATGLEAFAAICAHAADHLRVPGVLAFEHGAGQAAEVAALLALHGFEQIRHHADHAGLPRVTLATLRSSPNQRHHLEDSP